MGMSIFGDSSADFLSRGHLPRAAFRVAFAAMSFLDDQKRARKGAKSLVRLLTQEGRFDANLDEYANNDGIIDDGFLRQLDEIRPLLARLDDPAFANEIERLPVAFQEALLEFLAQKSRYDVLRKIADASKAKAVVKSAKQILHNAKAAGTYSPEKKAGSWKIAASEEEAAIPTCMTSPHDHNGDRLVVAGKDHPSGVRFLHVLENDRTGVVEHNSGVVPRSAYRKMLRDLRETAPDAYRDISADDAIWLIDRAMRRHERDQSALPAGFLTARSQFADRTGGDAHPFLAKVRPVELEHQENRAGRSTDLFAHPIAAAWSIDSLSFRRFQHRLSEHAKSREDLLAPRVRDLVRELIDETIAEYFDERTRQGFADRLMDLAWFIVDDQRDLALLAYGTAKAIADPSRAALSIPFCRSLLARFVPGQNDASAPAPEPLIVAP